MRGPFRHRDFRLVMGAKLLSVLGGQMQTVAIGFHVYQRTHDPLHLGLVGLAKFVPAFLLSLPAGQVADRFQRRKVLVVYHATTVVAAVLLALLVHHDSFLPLYGVLVLLGSARAFAGPANHALLPSLVPGLELSAAVAYSSSVWQVSAIAGPALGGLLLAAKGPLGVYVAAAIASTAALVQLALVRTDSGRHDKEPLSFAELFAGVRYVGRARLLLGAISLDLFAVLLGGAVALLPAFAEDVLHVGPRGLGVLSATPAVGALVTALLLSQRPVARRAGGLMLGGVLTFGVATIVFGLSRSFWLSLLALALVGAADMVSVVVRQMLLQLATPDAMRGRVSAVNLVFVGASNELGELESGLSAAWLGIVPAVVAGGVLTCVVVAVWALLFPELRRLDRLDDVRPLS